MRREERTHIPCHHVKIGKEVWVHIPGCWSAVHDPACCTCYPTGSELEEAISRRDEAERYIQRLLDRTREQSQRLNQMFSQNRKLRAKITRLGTHEPATYHRRLP